MARTKKYLTGNGSKKRSFYRPIKRIKKQSSVQTAKKESLETKVSVSNLSVVGRNLKPQVESKLNKEVEINKNVIQNIKLSKIHKTDEAVKKEVLKKVEKPEILNSKKLRSLNKPNVNTSLDNNLLAKSRINEEESSTEDESMEDITVSEDKIDFSSHSEEERLELLEKQLEESKSKEEKIKRDIEKMEDGFVEEKQKLENTIRTLKGDLHRADPIDHNKFFTISKELQEVVLAMDKLIETEGFDMESDEEGLKLPKLDRVISRDLPRKFEDIAKKVDEEKEESETEKNKKKGLFSKIPKSIRIIVLTLVLVGSFGGFFWYKVNSKKEVNQELLQEYLPKDAGLNPAAESLKKQNEVEKEATKSEEKTLGASDEKYTESQKEIPFSDTKWDTLKDGNFGIEINYPKNAVNVIKTDSSITFIRKTGYIFKVQLVETALSVQEYWKLIKSSSLNYKVKETTFRDKDALFLELEDFSDYPGDKYLVKNGSFIFDIWYGTYSNTLSDDDSKRIDIMLNSFKFTK